MKMVIKSLKMDYKGFEYPWPTVRCTHYRRPSTLHGSQYTTGVPVHITGVQVQGFHYTNVLYEQQYIYFN